MTTYLNLRQAQTLVGTGLDQPRLEEQDEAEKEHLGHADDLEEQWSHFHHFIFLSGRSGDKFNRDLGTRAWRWVAKLKNPDKEVVD
jgi:hypothetical protein